MISGHVVRSGSGFAGWTYGSLNCLESQSDDPWPASSHVNHLGAEMLIHWSVSLPFTYCLTTLHSRQGECASDKANVERFEIRDKNNRLESCCSTLWLARIEQSCLTQRSLQRYSCSSAHRFCPSSGLFYFHLANSPAFTTACVLTYRDRQHGHS